MGERIMTLHPDGKQGVNIDKAKYAAVAAAIAASIQAAGELSFDDLPAAVGTRLPADFDGSIGWYTTTVKLDLEARGRIERVPGATPQRLRLAAPAPGE